MNPYEDASDEELLAACRVETRRASGPGGQHRNKVETAVRIVHEPTGLVANASERRSQLRNRELALARLRAKLDRHFARAKPRLKTRKSKATRARERAEKRRRAERKAERRARVEE